MAMIVYTVTVEVDNQEWADEYGFGADRKQAGENARESYDSKEARTQLKVAVMNLYGFEPKVTVTARSSA